jgi:kynurenine 3-monooxygenase
MQKKEMVIIGAGLVGSLLSIYLAKRGHRVRVYERRSDMRRVAMQAGRSINLALSDRGIKALDKVGIMEDIRAIAIPMHGRYIHAKDGSHVQQPYGKSGQFINSVSRGELNKKLMDLAEQHDVQFYFEHKCAHIDFEQGQVYFETANDETIDPVQADIIFGSDGAYSAARLSHQLQQDRFQYQQYFIDCGYKELTIPAGPNGQFLLEKHALHIWPRKDYMLIALPNMDGSFTCTLFFPYEGAQSFEQLKTDADIQRFFEAEFADAIVHMPDYIQQFKRNPTASLVTVKCFPWIKNNRFALIGDAAHAIVPFFGQGMNCGFEDCDVLDELITKWGDDWSGILTAYQDLRKPDGDAIADLAIHNFVEMRDRVADPRFLFQKKIEALLHEKYPSQWVPAYAQVTFSPHIRYSEALANGQKQEAIMQEAMRIPDLENKWQDPVFLAGIIQALERKS